MRPDLRRPRDERGVMAIAIALITCFTLVPLAAYAVDIGVQRVARRDAQSVADLVALDLARQLDGRKYSVINAGLQGLADKSAARNSGGTGAPTVVPVLGTISSASYDPANPDAYFTKMTDPNGVPNAVRVTVTSSVNFTIQPGKGGVVRTAIGKAQSAACFDVGSYALNLDSQKSALLNSLVGDALNLSALTYTGLANANVSLLGLATELGAGSVDQLLALKNLSLNQLYLASATALQKSGGDTADVALLNQLANANLGALPHIKLSDLLDLEAGNNAALATSVNLLDIVATSAFVANGTNSLAIPDLTVGIPNIAGVTASLKVTEQPQRGCTTNPVKTSQVDLTVKVTLLDLDLLLLRAATTLTIDVHLASGTATRVNTICGTPEGIDVSVASGLVQLSVQPDISLKLLGLPIAHVYGSAGTTAPAANTTVQFRNPPDAYGTAKSNGSGVILPQLALNNLGIDLLGILPLGLNSGGILGAVVNSIITPVLNPLIAALNTLVLTPLTGLLGIKIGGADIYAVPHPSCNNPVLGG